MRSGRARSVRVVGYPGITSIGETGGYSQDSSMRLSRVSTRPNLALRLKTTGHRCTEIRRARWLCFLRCPCNLEGCKGRTGVAPRARQENGEPIDLKLKLDCQGRITPTDPELGCVGANDRGSVGSSPSMSHGLRPSSKGTLGLGGPYFAMPQLSHDAITPEQRADEHYEMEVPQVTRRAAYGYPVSVGIV